MVVVAGSSLSDLIHCPRMHAPFLFSQSVPSSTCPLRK